MRPTVSRAIQAARAGEARLRHILAGSVQGDVAGAAHGLNFMGGPDTVVKQMKAFHDRCGVGVVDLFSQQPSVSHREVMQEIALFGRAVLPRSGRPGEGWRRKMRDDGGNGLRPHVKEGPASRWTASASATGNPARPDRLAWSSC